MSESIRKLKPACNGKRRLEPRQPINYCNERDAIPARDRPNPKLSAPAGEDENVDSDALTSATSKPATLLCKPCVSPSGTRPK